MVVSRGDINRRSEMSRDYRRGMMYRYCDSLFGLLEIAAFSRIPGVSRRIFMREPRFFGRKVEKEKKRREAEI